MDIDLTVAPGFVESTQRRQIAAIVPTDDYQAGGETVDPGDFRMGKIFIVLGSLTDGTNTLFPFWVDATSKLQWFLGTTGLEASGDLSTYSGRIEVVGQ